MPSDAIPKIALRWAPNAGRSRRGRPKETWRISIEREMKENGLTWAPSEHRGCWRSLVLAKCAAGPRIKQTSNSELSDCAHATE